MSKDPAPPGRSPRSRGDSARPALGATGEKDRLLSVEDGPEIEISVKGSRFLGQVFRCDSEQAAGEFLQSVRRRYHDATHHCWGLRVRTTRELVERWDDDGEPTGSAGTPILRALQHSERVEALIVVTRYFGGVKLGTGGLARAYGDAARAALNAAPTRILWRTVDLQVSCDYGDIGLVEGILNRNAEAIRGVDRAFSDRQEYRVVVLTGRAQALREELTEGTGGRALIRSGVPGEQKGG